VTAGNDKTPLFQRSSVAKASDVAAHAWRAHKNGRVLSVHGLVHWLSMQSLRVSPRAVVRRVVAWVNGG
jgi:uncharacterized protein